MSLASRLSRPLRVFKFGGTSVGEASCIRSVAQIVANAVRDSRLVVVVSAMAGVTNKLIEAATLSQEGRLDQAIAIFHDLQDRHLIALSDLLCSSEKRVSLAGQFSSILNEGLKLCESMASTGSLSPAARDVISSLGERLSAPLVSAVLNQSGIESEVVDATEIIITDSFHGSAEPHLVATKQRCDAYLGQLLSDGVVPVVTGFIGATERGILTTLGRGGSDYSATILGAALDADEVVIWTDVDGILTADPRLVADACTIPELSYREAAELAHFGAKVLHPKTLSPVMQSEIPVWIKNTFASDQLGTRITPQGQGHANAVKAVTNVEEAAIINVRGITDTETRQIRDRVIAAIETARTNVLMLSKCSGEIRVAIPAVSTSTTLEFLCREFSGDENSISIDLADRASIVTLVGDKLSASPEAVAHVQRALQKNAIEVTADSLSECSASFAIPVSDMQRALEIIHRELQLGILEQVRPTASSPIFNLQASGAD